MAAARGQEGSALQNVNDPLGFRATLLSDPSPSEEFATAETQLQGRLPVLPANRRQPPTAATTLRGRLTLPAHSRITPHKVLHRLLTSRAENLSSSPVAFMLSHRTRSDWQRPSQLCGSVMLGQQRRSAMFVWQTGPPPPLPTTDCCFSSRGEQQQQKKKARELICPNCDKLRVSE